jgi:hypothetical protein
MQRIIDAPDVEWLTSVEAARWLNIPQATFLTLVREKVIPAGVKLSAKVVVWSWQAIVAASWMLRHRALTPEPQGPL